MIEDSKALLQLSDIYIDTVEINSTIEKLEFLKGYLQQQ